MEFGVVRARQNFGSPCSPSCSVCCVRARADVDTSAGRLSEAKTQRRRGARERVCERGGFSFVVLLFLYLSFKQGRKKTRRGEDVGSAGRLGEERRWVMKGCCVTWGSLRATLRTRRWLMRPGASDEGHVRVRRASEWSMVKEDVEMNWAKGSWCIRFRFCEKMSVEDRERLGCIELGGEYNLGV